ncbi:MAG: P-II family nitrogen regulator [Clostridiaceae bacterium]
MKKLEVILRPESIEDLKNELNKSNFYGITVSQVMGCGMQKGRKEIFRGQAVTINILHKIKMELVIKDEDVDSVVNIITKTARTGEVGDGKIFIYDVQDAIRIRTGERGETAIK